MDKELFQTALRVLQQINKRMPVNPEDAERVRQGAPPGHVDMALDLIAVEIIQGHLRKKASK